MIDIDARLAVALRGPEREPDVTALEPTERLFQACVSSGQVAEFGAAAVRALSQGFPAVCVLTRMFEYHPGMPGAAGWLDVLAHDPSVFPELPSVLPGDVGRTLRTTALKAGLTFSKPPRAGIVALARAHVVRPFGAYGLIYILWNVDRAWVETHVGEVLASNPDAAAQVFGQYLLTGTAPDAAMDAVLAGAVAVDASEFDYTLRRLTPDVQARLRARLAMHPQLAS